ncbi:hypothetical protein [Brevibacillus sp. SYSU BS000544]|uniref:hypothetical protein n=1 Tax=Brevibacillus sp. SYSU BS000544 TaxID=3416443 RepID=UPI003CE4555F
MSKPLTKDRLIQIIKNMGYILNNPFPIGDEQFIGSLFESWVLKFGFIHPLTKNTHPYPSKVLGRDVIPDAKGTLREVAKLPFDPKPAIREFPDSVFIEIKQSREPIKLSTGNRQIEGEIDVLSRKSDAIVPVFIVVTLDQGVDMEVAMYGEFRGVAVWNYKVWEHPMNDLTLQSPLLNPWEMPLLQLGQPQCMNPNIYMFPATKQIYGFPGPPPIQMTIPIPPNPTKVSLVQAWHH